MRCRDCGATTYGVPVDARLINLKNQGEVHTETRRLAVEKWNRRATPPRAEQPSRELTPKRRGEIAAICSHDEASETDCEAAINMALAEMALAEMCSRDDVLEEAANCSVNGMDISGGDAPHIVVEKYRAGIRALKGAQPSAPLTEDADYSAVPMGPVGAGYIGGRPIGEQPSRDAVLEEAWKACDDLNCAIPVPTEDATYGAAFVDGYAQALDAVDKIIRALKAQPSDRTAAAQMPETARIWGGYRPPSTASVSAIAKVPTPRTDAQSLGVAAFSGAGDIEVVPIDFARQLERELAAANIRCAELTKENGDLAYKERHAQFLAEQPSRDDLLGFIDAQEYLDAESCRLLRKNLWELYTVGSAPAAATELPEPRQFISEWLWQEKYSGRQTVDTSWSTPFMEDAAKMCADYAQSLAEQLAAKSRELKDKDSLLIVTQEQLHHVGGLLFDSRRKAEAEVAALKAKLNEQSVWKMNYVAELRRITELEDQNAVLRAALSMKIIAAHSSSEELKKL